jgi:hypothetical protein
MLTLQVCCQLVAAGHVRRAVSILHAAVDALAQSPADVGTGRAIVRALCSQRAPSSSMAAWALKVLPPEQEFYGRLLAKFRTSGNQKLSLAPCSPHVF